MGQSATHFATFSIEHTLLLFESTDLIFSEIAFQLLGNGVGISGDGQLEIVPHGQPLKQTAYDVEDLVGLELSSDRLQLVEKGLQYPSLARAAGYQVDDDYRIVGLSVAMDAAHPLFEPRRVPGDVVVYH